MARKGRKATKRHRLLVYHRLGQHLRTPPFFIAVISAILLAFAWMASSDVLQMGNRDLLARMWENRLALFLIIGVSALIYAIAIVLSRGSYIEARPKTLRIKAGLIPVDVSYGRIKQIRLVQFGLQYPMEALKGSDRRLAESFQGITCTVVDLQSLPRPFTSQLLKRMWHRFMFTGDGGSLMFVVRDSMLLNQQIDGYIAARQSRIKGADRYLDPIERAARTQQERSLRASKPGTRRQKSRQR